MKYAVLVKQLGQESKSLENIIKHIPGKNLKSDVKIIEALTKLAYINFLIGEKENCEFVTDKLSLIDFNDNYDYWTWIEFALCLRVELSLIKDDISRYENSINLIKKPLNSGDDFQKKIRNNVHLRFMAGEGVELNLDESNENVLVVFERKLVYLMKLLKLKAFGGSGEYAIQQIEMKIADVSAELKKFIDIDGVYSYSPFK